MRKRITQPELLELGYSSARRTVMFTIGEAAAVRGKGPYRSLYDAFKAHEQEKARAAGREIRPSSKIPRTNPEAYMAKGQIHRRAQRKVEKRMLKDLWQAWRRTNVAV